MPSTFTYKFDTPVFNGSTTFNTGLFIGGKFVDPIEKGTVDSINPANGRVITTVSVGTSKDVDMAVDAAKKAYKTSWGLKVPGAQRGALLLKLADLIQANYDELAALEALDSGKTFNNIKRYDLRGCLTCLRYFAGWADKVQGKTMETNDTKFAYTRHEPIGVVGQIIPWNFPLAMVIWKITPALATGNTVVLKPSEITPLSALRIADLINEAGFPPGVVNIVNGYGNTVGQAICEHMLIEKVAFTGSTLVGRKVMEAAAKSNLKDVTLELGGKSPNIIFDDANIEQVVKWTAHGIFYNHGQACTAGSRIYVHAKIYDEFLKKLTAYAEAMSVGDPFAASTIQGPQASQVHLDRILGYIESGKKEGGKILSGGKRIGQDGYYFEPTIFTDCRPDMKIVKEEIFGPVGVVVKFEDEADVIEQANNTIYGLACAVFSQDIDRALRVAHALEAGTAWINCIGVPDIGLPFGGYKQSGIGRDFGEYALHHYTAVKAVHINIGRRL